MNGLPGVWGARVKKKEKAMEKATEKVRGKREEVRGRKPGGRKTGPGGRGAEMRDHAGTLALMLQTQRRQLKPFAENTFSRPSGWTDADTGEAIRAYGARIAALECAIAVMGEVANG